MSTLHFHGFAVCPDERQVLVKNEPVKLSGRAFDMLVTLIARRDRVVTKDELIGCVWPGLVVEENNLQVHVSSLRRLLGHQSITTVPGRGYQFTAKSVEPRSHGTNASFSADEEAEVFEVSSSGNIPITLSPLFGRHLEVGELCHALESDRLVTISGAGGIGKTRLAQAVGQRMSAGMPHGVWMVELAPLSDPAMVTTAIAQTLGFSLNAPDSHAQLLVEALMGRSMVLILDNCEHLLDEVADLCALLLAKLPLLRILVTSQELLKLDSERVYKLSPLTLPDSASLEAAQTSGAVQLLVARVHAVVRSFQLTLENVADTIDICRQLDGLPLAIELAAARVPLLGIVGVRQRLSELFRLLTGDARVRLRRHQTLRAALDWSYQLLTPEEQVLFRRVGVFTGGFSVAGVQGIASGLAADEWQVLETLSALVDKSLVQVNAEATPRYSLLETTRAYAMEQLAHHKETDAVLALHARATRAVCEQAAKERNLESIWAEMANVRAAYAWALGTLTEAQTAVALATVSSVVLTMSGFLEGLQHLLAVEHLVDADTPLPLAARYWQWVGRCGTDGRLPTERCLQAFSKAEALFRQLRNERHIHACLRMRAEALMAFGDLEGAQTALHLAKGMEHTGWSVADRMRRLRVEGLLLDATGQYTQALNMLEEALEMANSGGIDRYAATLNNDIAHIHLKTGDALAAEQRFRHLMAQEERLGSSVGLVVIQARMGLALALLERHEPQAAAVVALDAVHPLRRSGILLARCDGYAWLLASLGHSATAAKMLGVAQAFRDQGQTEPSIIDQQARTATLGLLNAGCPPEQWSAWEAQGALMDEAAVAQILVSELTSAAH